jgi:MFS family permease
LRQQWGIGDIGFGYLSSAYSWTYALLQMPMGALLDSFGVRAVGTVAALLWSVASFAAALAPGLRSFFASRLLLGIAEAPTFPANAKAIAQWFPPQRRGMPTAIFDSSAKFATAIGVPVLGILLVHYGWRWSFAATGALSFAYFVAFALFYRDGNSSPPKKPRRSEVAAATEEPAVRVLGKSRHSDPEPNEGEEPAFRTPVPFSKLLTQRKVLGLTLGFSGYGYSFYLFLTWLPGYLSHTMHMDVLHSATAVAVPWGFATASDLLVGGWLVDFLIARGHPATTVRKWIVSVGLAMGLGIIGATQTTNPHIALAWITFALMGLAASAPVGWQIPALIAPPGNEARVASIMNCANNGMAIVAPIVTGYLVARTHEFLWPFSVAAIMVLLGIVGYTVVLGRIERVQPHS